MIFCAAGEHSLALRLARAGHDVWLGNNRGNRHSRAHARLKADDDAFWRWSVDELAALDLPAIVETARWELNHRARDATPARRRLRAPRPPHVIIIVIIIVVVVVAAARDDQRSLTTAATRAPRERDDRHGSSSFAAARVVCRSPLSSPATVAARAISRRHEGPLALRAAAAPRARRPLAGPLLLTRSSLFARVR